MGRHGRSNFAAGQALGPDPGPGAVGAANYVGRVGALALALGIGAVVAGGAGLANAEGTSAAGGGGAQPASDSTAGEGTVTGPTDATSHADGSTGAKPRTPGSSSVPKMELGGSNSAATNGLPGQQPGPDSLPGLIASIPRRIATLVTEASEANGPSTSPTRVGSKSQSHSPGSNPPSTALDQTVPAAIAGDTATARHAAAQPSVAALNVSPEMTTASESLFTFTAPVQAAQAQYAPVATMVSGLWAALDTTSSANAGNSPVAPLPLALGVLQLIRREIEHAVLSQGAVGAPSSLVSSAAAVTPTPNAAVTTPGVPSPGDVAHTPYGDVGTWLLQPNGQIANYGGVPHNGMTVLEPINVIIIDPTSTSPEQSTARLNAAMARAGFPAQPVHSTGFQGTVNGKTYGQQPSGLLQAFSDNFFVFPNDHGRMFGPAPAAGSTGYVWTGAFSTEQLNPANPFTHEYVSSEIARAELVRRLVATGGARVVDVVPLGNAYNTGTFTTGDHDGYAVVLELTPSVVTLLPTGGLLGAACGHVDDLPGPVARHVATDVCVVAASVSSALGLRSAI